MLPKVQKEKDALQRVQKAQTFARKTAAVLPQKRTVHWQNVVNPPTLLTSVQKIKKAPRVTGLSPILLKRGHKSF